MSFASFVIQYKWVFIFYIALALLFYIGRKNVTVQAKFIFLYRTLFGVRLIERIATRYREWVKLWGYIGVGVGFIGLVLISFGLLFNLFQVFFQPDQPVGVQPVLPGIAVPGIGVLPFWYWLIALFLIALTHEFSHGIVARAHDVRVKWTGVVLLGPIFGAFVEPDEKVLRKSSDIIQYSVYAAGAFMNIILAVVALLLMNFVFVPLEQSLVDPVGVTFSSYYNASEQNYPLARAGVLPFSLISSVNGVQVNDSLSFSREFFSVRPYEIVTLNVSSNAITGDPVLLLTRPLYVIDSTSLDTKKVKLTSTEHPKDKRRAFIGADGVRDVVVLRNSRTQFIHSILLIILDFLRWFAFLSSGIGFVNLLPLPIVDGGHMVHTFFSTLLGKDRGIRLYSRVATFFLLVLGVLIVIAFWRYAF